MLYLTFGQTTVGASYLMATVDQNGAKIYDETRMELSLKGRD